jgi:hypothetical protein
MATMQEKLEQARSAGYSDAEISKHLGNSNAGVKEALSQGYSLNEISSFLGAQTAPASTQYSYDPMLTGQPSQEDTNRGNQAQSDFRNVAGQAISNIPSSGAKALGDLYTAITSPLQTGKAVLDLGAGAMQNILPESLVQAIGEEPASRNVANQMGEFYQQRYGGGENIANTIATDPVGALADVSTLLYGGGVALRGGAGATNAITGGRVSLPSIAEAGNQLRTVGSMVDPLVMAGRGAGSVVKGLGNVVEPVLGLTTGAGRESISQAFQAGRSGGERATQFRENITDQVDQTEILDAARQNLNAMRTQRSDMYRSGMVDIGKDKTQLSFDGIDKALNSARNRTQYKDKVVDQTASDALTQARGLVDEWKMSDPATYHTPEGLDALKQSVGAILDTLEPNKNAFNTVNQVYNSIKTEIVKQSPVYANTMREYTQASDQIREIEKSLSLGNKTSADTAMRKLQSLMRDNVNTNFGQRVKVGKELETQGGRLMMPGLAGQALQSVVPRGLQGAAAIPTSALAFSAGGTLPALVNALASSPRVVGEAAYGLGSVGRGVDKASSAMPFLLDPELYNALYQSGRIQNTLEK